MRRRDSLTSAAGRPLRPERPDRCAWADEHRGRPGRPERRVGARSPQAFSITQRDV